LEAGLAADKFEVGWVVADGTDNKFPDDGGPESNPAGSGLFSVLSCESPLREPSAEGCLFKFGC